ncbi:hypothetical protein NXT3_PB00340 (plasmid) [Sinorhizobium fredii]|uniref:Uncharacterized protein n=1 Tax=Rhizobium fredii TaxID=380 RepID=A0A2L0HC05_RHIFR|nr:hypothetical protein NXT3_PB00340 [Sinorhizobium fredii]
MFANFERGHPRSAQRDAFWSLLAGALATMGEPLPFGHGDHYPGGPPKSYNSALSVTA